jgi:hypothetical protein
MKLIHVLVVNRKLRLGKVTRFINDITQIYTNYYEKTIFVDSESLSTFFFLSIYLKEEA